jgi:hypothetical protein
MKEALQAYEKQRAIKGKSVCLAPFNNLYFGHAGRVIARCYNRTHILGHWPKQSIRQIWFGEKADSLRQTLSKYDFSLGCKNCESQLLAKNFEGFDANRYATLPLQYIF